MKTSNYGCTCLEEWIERCMAASPSRNVLRHDFTVMLQYAFSDPSRLASFDESLGCLSYDPTKQIGTLAIEAGSTLDLGNTQNVPGIRVNMGQTTYDRVAIDAVGRYTPDTSGACPVYKASTTVTITCKHKDADVCGYMQEFVCLFFSAQLLDMRERHSWLLDFQPKTETEPTIKKAEGDSATYWYESQLTFAIDYTYSFYIGREGKRLKDYTVEAGGRLRGRLHG